jgi:amidohydrolase
MLVNIFSLVAYLIGVIMLPLARELTDQLVAWRQEFHQYPELGYQEHRTAGRVAEILEGLGYQVRGGVGRTGVTAELSNGRPRVAIRADMDALPIQEENQAPYASLSPGVMHACGHDAHTAIALGVAKLLTGQDLPGSVRFLFQPAEEVGDENGVSGAAHMIEDGAMQEVDYILALHVDAATPVGQITLDDGANSAGVDTFYATIIGKGGHGATPHKGIDPIHIAGHVILALNGIVSRRLSPFDPAVLSIGSIHGGQANNVIPDRVELSGTIRYLDKDVRGQILSEIERALSVARALGGDYKLQIEVGYPPMYNHAGVVHLVRQVACEMLGEQNVSPPVENMGAEDFGFFSNLAPGAMFYLGCRIENDERVHHHSRFDIDEGCLPFGAALLAASALRLLQEGDGEIAR